MCHTLSSAAAGLHTRTLSPSNEARALPVPASQSREGVRVTSAVSYRRHRSWGNRVTTRRVRNV